MALQSSSCTFVSLVLKISQDDSDDSWIEALTQFCSINAEASSLPENGKEEFLSLLKIKISEKCSENLELNLECK